MVINAQQLQQFKCLYNRVSFWIKILLGASFSLTITVFSVYQPMCCESLMIALLGECPLCSFLNPSHHSFSGSTFQSLSLLLYVRSFQQNRAMKICCIVFRSILNLLVRWIFVVKSKFHFYFVTAKDFATRMLFK